MRYELTQDLLTGNQLIDSEHRQLFDAINALLDACAQGAGRTKINETVQFLNSYVSKHFRDEEQLQLQSKYPGYNAHHTFHEGYKRELAAAANQIGAVEILKKNNVWIYGTDAAGTSYTDADFTGGTAFVIGSEGFGMSRLVGEKCDAMLSLPMRGKVNSLNASVAAGIFLYEAVRQRLAK